MRRFSRLVPLVLAASMLVTHTSARAGTVVAMSLEQMTARADLIFTGRVLGERADWNAERTRIFTYVTLEVDRYFKGRSESSLVTVRLLGGRVGRYIAHLPGSPKFAIGEKVLLFCAGEQARMPSVLGLSLGKFTIVTDTAGEQIVKRDISTLMLANYSTASRRPGDPVQRYRLSDVAARIEGYLQ